MLTIRKRNKTYNVQSTKGGVAEAVDQSFKELALAVASMVSFWYDDRGNGSNGYGSRGTPFSDVVAGPCVEGRVASTWEAGVCKSQAQVCDLSCRNSVRHQITNPCGYCIQCTENPEVQSCTFFNPYSSVLTKIPTEIISGCCAKQWDM